MKKKVTIVTTLFFIATLSAFLFMHITSTQAATAISNCIITKIGNPGPNITPPDGCQESTWPFPVKSPTQFRRMDQGWDLIFNTQTEVLAVAPGWIHKSNPNPGGFGPDYPYEVLDHPITVQVETGIDTNVFEPRTYTKIYYGHTHIIPSVDGTHVEAGTPISNTDPNGVNSSPNWLEIGFGNDNRTPAAVLTHQNDDYSVEGHAMCDWLMGLRCPHYSSSNT